MSNFKIKIDTKKLEKNINKQIEQIVYDKQKELIVKQQLERSGESMNILPSNEEKLLEIILNKYDGNAEMQVSGDYEEIPRHMHFSIKDAFNTLKIYNYIGSYQSYLNGWCVVLNQEGIEYFEKKGMRKELFEELADNEKELLKEIIETEANGGNISELLANKVDLDEKDIVRSIIGSLRKNGLINVSWASNTVCYASLTNPGRTYFEREEKYFKRMKLSKSNTYNFGDINVNKGNFVAGDVINSVLNVDNHITEIDNEIEERADEEDKEKLKELLEEAKEIIENMKDNGVIEKRRGFFKKITEHANKYGWFYAEIVNLIGTAVLTKIGG
jgi:hypothetical protein